MKARLAAAWSAVGLPLFLALALALVLGLATRAAKSEPRAIRLSDRSLGAVKHLPGGAPCDRSGCGAVHPAAAHPVVADQAALPRPI